MISLGGRSSQGVLCRSAFQFLSKRHISGGSQETPPSIRTNFSFGNFWNAPSVTRLIRCAM